MDGRDEGDDRQGGRVLPIKVLGLLEDRHVTLRLRDALDDIEALALQHTAEEFFVLGVEPPAISGAREEEKLNQRNGGEEEEEEEE